MEYISTGKAARLLSVTPDTVLKWIKQGKVEARRTAGGHYRIPVEAVRRSMTLAEGPTSAEQVTTAKQPAQRQINLLVFSDDKALKDSVQRESVGSRFNLRFASCEYDCSFIIERFRPEYVLVDCAMELEKCEQLCDHLANDPRIPGAKIILATRSRNAYGNTIFGNLTIMPQPFSLAEIEKTLFATTRQNLQFCAAQPASAKSSKEYRA